MRTIIIVIVCLMAMNPVFAQNSLNQFFNSYSELEDINKITLEGGLLKMISQSEDEVGHSLAKLDKLSALWTDEMNPISKKEVNQLLRGLRRDNFESLLMVREGSSNVNFLVQENGTYITGVILIVDGIDSFLLVNLKGKLKFEDLGNMDLDIEGMEHFKKLPKDRSKLKRA